MLQNGKKVLVLVILLGLIYECWGMWCNTTEIEYVLEKHKINVIKYKTILVKCHWYSVSKSCTRKQPYSDIEWKKQWVPRNVPKQICCTGYSEELGQCVPICENSCINSKCVAPNTCKCNIGYKIFSEEALNKCIPHCDECDFGTCIAPGVCKCSSGYKKEWNFEENREKCAPYCEGGCPRRSFCSQPGICTCLEPFTEVNVSEGMICLGEGETLEPPTTTTEISTSTLASTTTPDVEDTSTTSSSTLRTTEITTSTLTTTTTPNIEDTSTTSSSTLRTTDFLDDSTDYSDIEEVPEEDPENSTLSAQLIDAEYDLENVSDDLPNSSTMNSNYQDTLDIFDESVKAEDNGAFGKFWYIFLAIAIILCVTIALKIYSVMQMKNEYKISNELPEVHYTIPKV